MENQSSSQTQLTKRRTDPGEFLVISNPVEFESPVRFLELIETPLETVPEASATPSVLNNTKIVLSSTAPVNITNFTGGQEGQTIFVVGDGNSTVVHGTNIFTNTAANKLLAAGSVYVFTLVDQEWRELAGSSASSLSESVSVVDLGPSHTFAASNTDEDYPNILHYSIYDTSEVTEYRFLLRYYNATAAGTKQVKIWYSTNASSWTQLGSTLSSSATSGSLLTTYAAIPGGAVGTTIYFKVTVQTTNSPGDVISILTAQLNFR